MKKKYKTLILILVSLIANAQSKNILIQYESVRNNITNIETLIANNQNALFIIDSLFIENDDKGNKNEDDSGKIIYAINQKKIQFDTKSYYISLNSPAIFFTTVYNQEKVLVKDDVPPFKWNLSSKETRKIGNYLCKKATTTFRGSEIVAWYTENLNFSFGPWKFKGLPGLILEVYNVNSKTIEHWTAKKIFYPYEKKVKFDFNTKLKTISYKQEIDANAAQIEEYIRLMNARAPKGITSEGSSSSRNGIEQVYEWEKK